MRLDSEEDLDSDGEDAGVAAARPATPSSRAWLRKRLRRVAPCLRTRTTVPRRSRATSASFWIRWAGWRITCTRSCALRRTALWRGWRARSSPRSRRRRTPSRWLTRRSTPRTGRSRRMTIATRRARRWNRAAEVIKSVAAAAGGGIAHLERAGHVKGLSDLCRPSSRPRGVPGGGRRRGRFRARRGGDDDEDDDEEAELGQIALEGCAELPPGARRGGGRRARAGVRTSLRRVTQACVRHASGGSAFGGVRHARGGDSRLRTRCRACRSRRASGVLSRADRARNPRVFVETAPTAPASWPKSAGRRSRRSERISPRRSRDSPRPPPNAIAASTNAASAATRVLLADDAAVARDFTIGPALLDAALDGYLEEDFEEARARRRRRRARCSISLGDSATSRRAPPKLVATLAAPPRRRRRGARNPRRNRTRAGRREGPPGRRTARRTRRSPRLAPRWRASARAPEAVAAAVAAAPPEHQTRCERSSGREETGTTRRACSRSGERARFERVAYERSNIGAREASRTYERSLRTYESTTALSPLNRRRAIVASPSFPPAAFRPFFRPSYPPAYPSVDPSPRVSSRRDTRATRAAPWNPTRRRPTCEGSGCHP